MNTNYLELKGVSKTFPGFKLSNISFFLPKRYIMRLVGPNGAGKTTTIETILNMFEKNAGEILIFGKDHIENERMIKQNIGVVFDNLFYVDSWDYKRYRKSSIYLL